ncbi:MAG: ribonuclease PH [Christensenellaceae bacterium]|jgi:ribonuclease PH
MTRIDGRAFDALRKIEVKKDFMPNSGGSCLISFGNTQIIVTANMNHSVPPFLEGKGQGWLTAEYAMLPGSTSPRKWRERSKLDGRSSEIQRLIGRSLRSVMDFTAFADMTFTVDADVIAADGGTRTAAITGGYIALSLLVEKLLKEEVLAKNPIKKQIAAVSAGIVAGEALLDLCYAEDSRAEADMNFVGTASGGISEIQIAGEARDVEESEFLALLALCQKGVRELIAIQQAVLKEA